MKFFNFNKSLNLFKKRQVFEDISGYEDEKWLLEQALNNEQPQHILLKGPPGIGKTRFLKAIEKYYPDLSYFALASGSTGAGMINQCFETQPRFLLIDEIEDMRSSDQATLLSLLQDGVLVETKISKTRKIEFKCSVIATCNDTKKLRKPLLTRFAVIEMGAYTREQFIETAVQRLKNNPLAHYIAESVYEVKGAESNIRDCVRIGEMAKTEQDVWRILHLVK